jgi:hypothetical protein
MSPTSSLSAITLIALLSLGGVAHSATNTVTSLADSGLGSLRQTMADSSAGDSIVFGVAGAISLSSELVVDKDLRIIGPGNSALTLRGGLGRIFNIQSNVTVLISSLTIRDGRTGPGQPGGAIYNAGNLSVTNCVIANNATRDTEISGVAGACGGAIYNIGRLGLEDSIVHSNKTGSGAKGGSGGGLWNAGNCFANRCSFSGNATGSGLFGFNGHISGGGGGNGGDGGGIWTATEMALTQCTMSNNTCGGECEPSDRLRRDRTGSWQQTRGGSEAKYPLHDGG